MAAKIAAIAILAPAAMAQDDHVLIESDAFTYAPGPASLAEGAEYQVLYGDPGGKGVFAMRLKLPDGFHIAPHHHSQPEIVTVISGTFRLGMGEEADPEDTTTLEPRGGPCFPDSSISLVRPDGRTSPMTGKRKRYSAAFKAKVALEAIRGELTMAQLVTKHGVHQTLISAWKRQAVDGMSGVFSAKVEVAEAVREGELEKLHAKIGQLVVERDFLRKASGR